MSRHVDDHRNSGNRAVLVSVNDGTRPCTFDRLASCPVMAKGGFFCCDDCAHYPLRQSMTAGELFARLLAERCDPPRPVQRDGSCVTSPLTEQGEALLGEVVYFGWELDQEHLNRTRTYSTRHGRSRVLIIDRLRFALVNLEWSLPVHADHLLRLFYTPDERRFAAALVDLHDTRIRLYTTRALLAEHGVDFLEVLNAQRR